MKKWLVKGVKEVANGSVELGKYLTEKAADGWTLEFVDNGMLYLSKAKNNE